MALRSSRLLIAPLFLLACSRGVSTTTTNAPPPSASAAVAPSAASASAPAPAAKASSSTSLPPAGTAPRFDSAVLLANGHVLMPAKDVVYDWDPFAAGVPAMRRASLGDAGPAHTFSFVPHGGKNFVVAKTDEQDKVRFELWDAEKLVLLRALEGGYVAEDPLVEFSRDGKRLMLIACAAPRSEARVCDVGVYDLANGALIHRTKLPPLATKDRNRIGGRLSPTGKYFALSGDDFVTEAYEADTGRRIVVQDPAASAHEIDDGEETAVPLHFVFIDEHRILTASAQTGLRLTDLSSASGRSKTFGLGNAGSGSGSPRILLSPDRTRAATEITRDDGSFGVILASFDGAERGDQRDDRPQREQREQREHLVPVPRRVCPSTCTMRWSAAREVVLHPNIEGTPLEFRVNAVTSVGITQPYREPPPFEVFEAHYVRGDFDRHAKDATSAKGKWYPEDRSKTYPKGALVTPQGARVNLATVDMSSLTSASGNHFFMQGLDALRLIKSDGTMASLTPTRASE